MGWPARLRKAIGAGAFRSTAPAAVLALVAAAQSGASVVPFTEEAVQRGLVYVVKPYSSSTQILYFGYGCAIADLNSNGHQDIVVLGRADEAAGIFQNDGTGHFTDRSEASGIPAIGRGSGIAIADFNGNGLLDIYVTQDRTNNLTQASEPNLLLRNNGDFTFTDVAATAGVGNIGRGQGAAWGDFDNDGWLDLYLTNWTHTGLPATFNNFFYRNLGNESFESVGPQYGVDDSGLGYSAVWTDINRNGWLDLYLVNDRGHDPNFPANRLWRNDEGVLVEISESSGANIGLYGMSAGCGDVSGNGYPDFYVTNIPAKFAFGGKNPLLLNQGDETFVEASEEAGVDHYIYSWAGIFFDWTNNGHLDLYVSNLFVDNTLYRHPGTFPLIDDTVAAGVGGLPGRGFSGAVGDVTGNGALDLLTNDQDIFGGPGKNVRLYINHEGATRNWIRFNVVGYPPNHFAVGGNVEIQIGENKQWREIYAGGNNYKAQNELVFHFGIDDASSVDEITVRWPGNQSVRTLTNYPANSLWTIYPPERLGDFNDDGVIDIFDLLAALAGWGPVKPGYEIMDINGDGVIDIFDLLGVLAKWGPL